MLIVRKIGRIAATLAVIVGSLLGLSTAAHAASNGQQIMVIDNTYRGVSAWVSGTNQNGNSAATCMPISGFENPLNGWYWKGTVYVTVYDGSGCRGLYNSSQRDVPTYDSTDYWVVPVSNDNAFGNQQIVFYDNQHIANSFSITGYNQGGAYVTGCWNTPGFKTIASGWWWKGRVTVSTYPQTGCNGGATGQFWNVGSQDGTYFGVDD